MQFNSYDMLSMLTLLVSRIQKNQKNITVRSFKKIIPSRNPIWTVISDIPLSCASMLTMLVSRVKKNHEVLRSDNFKNYSFDFYWIFSIIHSHNPIWTIIYDISFVDATYISKVIDK